MKEEKGSEERERRSQRGNKQEMSRTKNGEDKSNKKIKSIFKKQQTVKTRK